MVLDRYRTDDLKMDGKRLRYFLEHSRVSKLGLQLLGVLGVSMAMADGMLAPAQSVLGAIQGIQVANANMGRSAIVGISCGILVALFLVQPFGTSKIGTAFAPIVTIWLLFNLCAGVYNLMARDLVDQIEELFHWIGTPTRRRGRFKPFAQQGSLR